MKEFQDYDIKYPELIIEILEHFNLKGSSVNKTVLDFCNHHKDGIIRQPQVVVKICEILCDNNNMSLICRAGALGMKNCYMTVSKDDTIFSEKREIYAHYFNSMVYGFEYIYRYYLDKVIPIIAYKDDGTPMMGTAFKFYKGLVTAKHCVTDGKTVAIKGYNTNQLGDVYVSKNPDIDVAYIHTDEKVDIFSDTPTALDDILVMGFPNIPRFLNFCTAEKATISSISDLRMTPTRGSIAAVADEMGTYKETKLMLITAKIKGGNSGGPIINKNGCVTGVAFGSAIGEGNYDDLGYGIATPISIINNIIEDNNIITVKFIDFAE